MSPFPGLRPVVAVGVCSLLAIGAAVFRPGYFSNADELAVFLFLQILLVAIWRYRTRFLPVLLAAFLWAGTALPLHSVWTSARWVVLGVGALAGVAVYIKHRPHYFSFFHLVALCCVMGAVVSALVSAYPSLALLKALSLLLLFVYCSTGARLAAHDLSAKFLTGLLLGSEALVYGTAIAYFAVGAEIFGNPNSLGALMGVVAVPLLLWGILVATRPSDRYRRSFAFLLALLLLLSSYARAGIAAAAVSSFLLCFALRRYASLIKGMAVALLLALFVTATVPLPDRPAESLTSTFLYKGRREDGILGSRRSVWDRTVSVIEEHPWFGSGFGTSLTGYEEGLEMGNVASAPQATREHGNSYLAITEWGGLFGGVPFFALVVLVAANVVRAFSKTRQIRDSGSLRIPLAAVLAAGLVHAGFEDWLFAVGYYLCIFFWALAFIIVDVLHATAPVPQDCQNQVPQPWMRRFSVVVAGR